MSEETKKTRPQDECAQSCNTEWQECQEQRPEEPSACHTRLARCVKTCTEDEGNCEEEK